MQDFHRLSLAKHLPECLFQNNGQAFQTLGRAFEAIIENQKLAREFEKLGRVFKKIGHVFVLHQDPCCPSQPWCSNLPLTRFHQICLFVVYPFFSCSALTDYCKSNAFSKQNNFFVSTYCWSVLILLFCVYMFLRAIFLSFAIIKLRIASCLHICIAS